MSVQPDAHRWRFDDCDKKTVLFVGRFDRLKGGDVVLGAFARLAREVPDARLVFVGPDDGFRDDAGKVWGFDDYVRAHVPGDVAPRIQMLGQQPPSAIADLRRRAFVTLLASRFETFSMTAVEALSFGCPLVAPAAAAIVEIVAHERNGLLFKAADAADAAHQLLRLFRDPELAQRLAAEGAADATRRFAPEVVARQMVAFYDTVRAPDRLRWSTTVGPPTRGGDGERANPAATG
ncbi:MAG: glycosyltransferase family 4 protein [Deltaproteobacteria bacterium]|nr:glycosyltransferase family 4 protein [Deltaproteobacteria bacterium]